jgi:energy-coupling factor transporter ATP-binding protein EcfA2
VQIRELRLQNFKRFTDLTIRNIPSDAKLVLLIGANGCGKSSVFDAFNWLSPPAHGYQPLHLQDNDPYFSKNAATPAVTITTDTATYERSADAFSKDSAGKFYGRSSLRITPRIKKPTDQELDVADILRINADTPSYFIDQDERFAADVHAHADLLNQALQRLLVEGKANEQEVAKVRDKYISKVNTALSHIFGEDTATTLRFAVYKQPNPRTAVEPYFKKGNSEIPFELLSHGEKQVVIILFNLLVRQDYLADKIIYIDEMDGHMNARLQFDLLKEVTENWIPATSQLWTASHALGFIDYACQAPHATIIDFDSLDFDIPQTLTPEPKENLDVLEIAIPHEFLGNLLAERRFVFCEGEDTSKYNSLQLPNVLFASNRYNKFQVFVRARDTKTEGIIDRDYLSDTEVEEFERIFPFIHILRYYSIENYLYHPDNLAEVVGSSFDKADYIQQLLTIKNRIKEDLVFGIQKARESYPFDKELQGDRRKQYSKDAQHIRDLLNSDAFETFYKVFPAKDYGKELPQRANRNQLELSRTQWFKEQIAQLLKRTG